MRHSRVCLLLALAIIPLGAQGVTSAALSGRVLRADSTGVGGARVLVVSETSGEQWKVDTRATGRFVLETLPVGAYRVEVHAIGFTPQTRRGIVLTLGQRHLMDIVLTSVIELPAVSVRARGDPVLNPGRNGPQEIISRRTIAEMPNLGRTFVNVMLVSPQVSNSPPVTAVPTSGVTIAGQNRVFNNFQVDGATNHDAFRGQSLGRQALPRPVSLEALEEVQVLSAPFDVRFGAFTGGLVNAVTRSGGNTTSGSAFGFFSNSALVRRRGIGGEVGHFAMSQFGGTIGGPIVRDHAHYFLSVDVQRRVVPDPGPLITDTAGGADLARIGISYGDVRRLHDILETSYGLSPGTLGPVEARAPAADVFGKISLQAGTNSHVDVTQQYSYGDRRDFMTRTYSNYFLSSFAQAEPSTVHATRVNWTKLVGNRLSNEMRLSHLRLNDECRPSVLEPEIRVQVPGPEKEGTIFAGSAAACQPNAMRQTMTEIREDATIDLGRHILTAGTHLEVVDFRDELIQQSAGLWIFSSVDAVANGVATAFQRTLAGPAWDGAISFHALTAAFYAQNRWAPTDALTLTLGLRADLPYLPDKVATNTTLRDSLGLDTGRLPTARASWAPRLGVNYNVRGRSTTFLRGGVGLFTGQMPYRWVSNAYREDGAHELFINCRGGQVPQAFTPLTPPSACRSGQPKQRPTVFDPATRLPQNLKASAGVDQQLPAGLVVTIDVLYTRATRQIYFTDANLTAPTGVAAGEGGRLIYGTISANGAVRPSRIDTVFDAVFRGRNASGDNALMTSVQLRTQRDRSIEGSVGYSTTRSRDRMWLAHFPGRALLEGTVLEGSLENRALSTSWFDVPHRVQGQVTVTLPYRSRLSLLYSGASGRPFTYTVIGDANADGLGSNLRQDAVYVPRDSMDITLDSAQNWAALDSIIRSLPCLDRQRGRVMARNSCRNPWFGALSARATRELPAPRGRSLELSADLYNVLNLLNPRWGLSRYDGLTFGTDLLEARGGYDVAGQRGRYGLVRPPRGQLDDLASRWQLEISARYVF